MGFKKYSSYGGSPPSSANGNRNAAMQESSILSVQQSVAALLGGENLSQLESVSLRLQKMVQIGQRITCQELQKVCSVAERNKECLKNVPASFVSIPGMEAFTLKLGGRMMVDQTGGVLENANLCLHRNLGFPMIPGSALKGIARHAAWCLWLKTLEAGNQEEAKRIAGLIASVFGYPTGDSRSSNGTRDKEQCLDIFLAREFPDDYGKNGRKTAQAGAVSFLSAVPADQEWKLVVDVLTPHPQRDGHEESPKPIFFLAVERGVQFRFAVAPVVGRGTPETLNFALEMLKTGLSSGGAGAKTAAGYGWFDSTSEEKIVERSTSSPEELEAAYQKEVNAISINGLEEVVDSLASRDEIFQKLYIIRLMKEKAALLRKWERKGKPRLKVVQEIAEKLNLELTYK